MSTFLPALSKQGAKLLLFYLETGGRRDAREEMTGTGVSRTKLYEARDELEVLGLTDERGALTWRPARMAPLPVVVQAAPARELPDEPSLPGSVSEDLSVRQRAMQADLMDDSGEWNAASSPRNQRRRAQVAVLRDAWRETFGKELTEDNAGQMVSKSGGYCEGLLDVFRDAKSRFDAGRVQSPLSWVLGKLTRQQEEAKNAGASPQVKQSGVGQPGAPDEGILMADFTQETKARQAKAEAALKKRGRRLEDEAWGDGF